MAQRRRQSASCRYARRSPPLPRAVCISMRSFCTSRDSSLAGGSASAWFSFPPAAGGLAAAAFFANQRRFFSSCREQHTTLTAANGLFFVCGCVRIVRRCVCTQAHPDCYDRAGNNFLLNLVLLTSLYHPLTMNSKKCWMFFLSLIYFLVCIMHTWMELQEAFTVSQKYFKIEEASLFWSKYIFPFIS